MAVSNGRGKKDGEPYGGFDNDAAVPKDKMAALGGIEQAKSSNCALSIWEICGVTMLMANGSRAEVISRGGENAEGKLGIPSIPFQKGESPQTAPIQSSRRNLP